MKSEAYTVMMDKPPARSCVKRPVRPDSRAGTIRASRKTMNRSTLLAASSVFCMCVGVTKVAMLAEAANVPAPTPAVTFLPRITAIQGAVKVAKIPTLEPVPLGLHAPTSPRISSPFGMRRHPVTKERTMHHGVDIPLPNGTIVRSPELGVVKKITRNYISGNCVVILHEHTQTRMCHLDTLFVRVGQSVGDGQPVALSGQTGRVTGPHLHLEVKKGGRLVDPSHLVVKVLQKRPEVVK